MIAAERAPAASRARWAVLSAYALLAASTQLLWLSFAAVDTRSASAMSVDTGAVGDLAAVFPFVYVLLALPTGRWLDSRFAHALGSGALLTGIGALVRVVAPTSFSMQVAGQLVIAAGQPLVLNSITKVAARHFPPEQRATAISLGTVALFAGILAAVLGSGPLFDRGGLPLLLGVHAGVAVAACVAVVASLRVRPAFADDARAALSLRWLAHDRFMWLLAGLVFVGMGTYNAVATWLQPILDRVGEGSAAGNLVAVMTFAGVVGAGTLPPALAAHDRRRGMLLVALATSAVAFTAITVSQQVVWVGVWLAVEGVVLLASLPVVLEWSEVHGGPERQGAATGFLMMAGNLGGVVLVLVVQGLLAAGPRLALASMAVVGLAGVPLAVRLPSRSGAVAAAPAPAVATGVR